MRFISIVVPNSFKLSVGLAANERVGAFPVGIAELSELVGCHIGWIEVGARLTLAVSIDKRLARNAVPRAVVYQGVGFCVGLGNFMEDRFLMFDDLFNYYMNK